MLLHFIPFHFPSFHFTSLHFILLHFISFWFTLFYFTLFHFTSFHLTFFHLTSFRFTFLESLVLQHFSNHQIATVRFFTTEGNSPWLILLHSMAWRFLHKGIPQQPRCFLTWFFSSYFSPCFLSFPLYFASSLIPLFVSCLDPCLSNFVFLLPWCTCSFHWFFH